MKTNRKTCKASIAAAVLLAVLTAFSMLPLTAVPAHAQDYNLWVGGEQVTSDHLSGEGWSYDGNGTLTLTNAVITESYEYTPAGFTASIYSWGLDLTIVVSGVNRLEGASVGIKTSSIQNPLTIRGGKGDSLTIAGDTSSNGLNGIDNSTGIKITGGCTVTVTSATHGIFSQSGPIEIVDSTVSATGTRGMGIVASSKTLSIKGDSTVTAQGNQRAIEAGSGIIPDEDRAVLEPKGGYYSGSSVRTVDGAFAKRARIAEGATIAADADPAKGGKVTGGGGYEFGDTVTVTATPNEHYLFVNWTENGEEVSKDGNYSFIAEKNRSLTANFEKETYTVTFKDEDGTVLQESSVPYDETPVYGKDEPTKPETDQYTYTFAGWTPEVVPVTREAEYTASYKETVREYPVTFLDEDGTQLQAGNVPYGETPEYSGETPVKKEDELYTYEFAGWTPEIAAVTGEASYKASYTAIHKTGSLTFDLGGGTLGGKTGSITIEANVGDEITIPDAPTRKGYTFKYWKGSNYAPGDRYKVEGDHSFTAVWEKEAPVTGTPTPAPTLTPTPAPTPTKKAPAGTNSAKTGDESHAALWIVLLGAAVLAGTPALLVSRRMKRN